MSATNVLSGEAIRALRTYAKGRRMTMSAAVLHLIAERSAELATPPPPANWWRKRRAT